MTSPQQPSSRYGEYATLAAAVLAAQHSDEDALQPALAAYLNAVVRYAATAGLLTGAPLLLARKIGYHSSMIGPLQQLAERALQRQRTWSGPRAAEELLTGLNKGAAAGVEEGFRSLAESAKYIVRAVRDDGPRITLPGEIYKPAEIPSYLDRETLALPLSQTVKHSATETAAAAAGWTRKTWHNVGDDHVRSSHVLLGSPSYAYHSVGIFDPFITDDGEHLRFPGDTRAALHQWIRCRCYCVYAR